MKKCYFEVGKTYIDRDREKFNVVNVEFVNRDEGYYEITTDKLKFRFWDDGKMFDQYLIFCTGTPYYKMLVELNENPKKKNFICVVPGAYVICDSYEEDPQTNDYVDYAVFGKTWCNYYNDNKLTPDERKWLHEHVAKMQAEMTA